MERLVSTMLALYLVTAFYRTDVRAQDSPFHSYDCYKDLCVDRLQFCDDREERCKMCTPGHCLPGARTPEQCKPHCPELLKPSTTQSTTSSQTLITRLTTTPSPTSPQVNAQTDKENLTITLSTNEVALASGVLALFLLVLLVLVGATLHVAKDTRRQFQQYTRHAFGRKEALSNAEDGEALLPTPWGSSSSGGGVKTAGGHSGNSSTASTAVKTGPAPEILNPSGPSPASSNDTMGGAGPSYTARPATGPQDSPISHAFPDTGSTSSLRHHKGCDYRLMQQQPDEDDHCHGGPPPYRPRTRQQHQGAGQTQSAFCDARNDARHHDAAAYDHGTRVKSI